MNELINQNSLFQDVCQIIESAKRKVAVRVNSEVTLMYWHIGHRINTDVLDNKRANMESELCQHCRHN
jgi:hypothetical protein